MARYVATELVYVNNTLIEPGVEFDYVLKDKEKPGSKWVEVDAEAKGKGKKGKGKAAETPADEPAPEAPADEAAANETLA